MGQVKLTIHIITTKLTDILEIQFKTFYKPLCYNIISKLIRDVKCKIRK